MKRISRFVRTYGKALMKAFWALGPGVLTVKGRGTLRQIATLSPWGGLPLIQRRFKATDIGDVCDGLDIRVVLSTRQTGEVADLELLPICALVRSFSPKRLFEIGTFRGRTTVCLALNSPANAEVFTLDLPAAKAHNTHFPLDGTAGRYIGRGDQGEFLVDSPVLERSKIIQLWGDSAQFDFGPYRSSIDFVFVDGAHSYDYVINDTKVAFSLLRDGKGVIVWHDYARKEQPEVARALEDLSQDPRYQIMSESRWIGGTTLACLVVGACNNWKRDWRNPRPSSTGGATAVFSNENLRKESTMF